MSRILFNNNSSAIFIDCRIHGTSDSVNNARNIKLVLDTGSTHTIISPDAISGLGYDQDILNPKTHKDMFTVSDKVTCPIIEISHFHCMGQIVKGLEVGIYNLYVNQFERVPAQGLLGMNFLNKFDYKITFSKGLIEVYKPKSINQNKRSRKRRRR